MRICLDMDGTITEGRFLEPPRSYWDYFSLQPYDVHVKNIYNILDAQHDLYIITARSEPYASTAIKDWLYHHEMAQPSAIITNPIQGRKNFDNAKWKWELIRLLGCELVFDDSPNMWNESNSMDNFYIIDNPHWKENQEIYTPNRIHSWKQIGDIIEANNH